MNSKSGAEDKGRDQSPKQGTTAPVRNSDVPRLEAARLLWLVGDWTPLAEMSATELQSHPDRAELASLIASALFQLGAAGEAQAWVGNALEWGADRDATARMLLSGAYNSLGRAALLLRHGERAEHHTADAISIGMPAANIPQIIKARMAEQAFSLQRRRASDEAAYLAEQGREHFVGECWMAAKHCFSAAIGRHPDVASYHQWLGETEARLGHWDAAVQSYRAALKRDPKAGITFYHDLKVKTAQPGPNYVPNPVFVAGCGHSGTSIMLALLGAHPALHPIPQESGLFLKTDEGAEEQMAEWEAQCAKLGKRRWVEKTPPHIFQIGRLLKLRPEAQFILMLRDGRDVVCSLKRRSGFKRFEDRLDRWIYDNVAGLPYWDHPQVKVVKYEDFVEHLKKTLKDICGFLGEDYAEDMLKYHEQEHHWYSYQIERPEFIISHRDHMNLRNWQINQPLFDGRGRWKREMSRSAQLRFAASAARELQIKFGYEA